MFTKVEVYTLMSKFEYQVESLKQRFDIYEKQSEEDKKSYVIALRLSVDHLNFVSMILEQFKEEGHECDPEFEKKVKDLHERGKVLLADLIKLQ